MIFSSHGLRKAFFALPLIVLSSLDASDSSGKRLCEKDFSSYKNQLAKNPSDDLTWTEFRVCASELKKWDEAIQVALQARQKNKNLPQPYLILGLAQMHQKNFERAIEHFDQSIALNSMQPLAYFQMGMAYLFLNEPTKAAQAAERAIELDPTNSAYHRQLAYTRLLLDDLSGAELSAKRAIQLDKEDLAAHKILAKIYTKAGNTTGAASELAWIKSAESAAGISPSALPTQTEPSSMKAKDDGEDEEEKTGKQEDYQVIGQCIGQWTRMKSAVLRGNLNESLTYYSDYLDTRDQYRSSFEAMGMERLKSIFGNFGDLYDCEVVFASAHCKAMVHGPSGAVVVTKIRFEKNPDKVWRIRSF